MQMRIPRRFILQTRLCPVLRRDSRPLFSPVALETNALFYSAPITFQTRPNRRHCSRLTREFYKFTLLKGRRDEGLVCNSRDFVGTDVNNFLEYYSVIFIVDEYWSIPEIRFDQRKCEENL